MDPSNTWNKLDKNFKHVLKSFSCKLQTASTLEMHIVYGLMNIELFAKIHFFKYWLVASQYYDQQLFIKHNGF